MEQGQWNDTETDLLKSGPCSLEKLCNRKILDNILLSCGRKIEDRARLILEASNGGSSSATRSVFVIFCPVLYKKGIQFGSKIKVSFFQKIACQTTNIS